ncbi:insecticidal delta-endotoxin Cry8Ea1 family protein [Bacillus cereus]|nr:insecticidal delta-endotoxin Cry8Ea1 family protein [Bacillus cereus]
MNQYYNNNEYEILDNGGRGYQPRYPLAQAPGSEFQQMNYKDWMDRYTGEEQAGGLIRAEIDANTALTATFGVAWAVLGVSNPVGSAIAGILNVVTPIIFNQVDPNSPLKVWESMIGYAQALIKKELTETVRNLALDHIDRINDYQIDYKNKARIWEGNPTPGNASQLLDAFKNLKKSCQDAMPHLDTRGYETILLPLYAQAANIHLIVLRDGLMHGRSWGMTNEEYEDLYSGFFGFKNRIATYTNYCTNTFNQGATTNYTADMEDCAKYPWVRYNQDEFYSGFFGPENSCRQSQTTNAYPQPKSGFNQPLNLRNSRQSPGEYRDVEAWNLRNEFISSMTIQVLDTVALWPTYDPRVYTSAVKTEFTREIYTSIRGTTYRSDPAQNTMSAIEARMIRPPHLFEWPQTMTFFFEDVNVRYTWVGNSWTKGQALIGLKTESARTLDTNMITALQGLTDEYEYYHIPLDVSTRQKDITNIRTKQWFEPREFIFYRSGGQQVLALGTIEEDIPGYSVYLVNDYIYTPSIRQNTFPPIEVPEGTPPPSHRLSWVKFEPVRDNATTFVDPKQIGATIFGWTHTSVDPNNTIDATKITQIPAVKASGGTDYQVIKGPGSTGGDLVSLPTYAKIEIPLTSSADQLYEVRIRYAAAEQKRIRIGKKSRDFQWRYIDYDVPSTPYSGGNLTYNAFSYKELGTVQGVLELSIERIDPFDEPIIIDKIEFIPIQGSVETYEADQDLEKARKAVNALFTSDAKNALQLEVTDYLVDQAAKLVECMSDEIYPQEKMCLLDQVKVAKRLSQARNLLHHGDFESPDWFGENGWKTSNHVSVTSGNPIFKGRYLNMPGADNPQLSDTVFPTYAYQKIDESKLKPYTRYMIRGFVGNSKDLEVFITRYDKEVHKNMNVPHDILPTDPCTGTYPLGEGPMLTNHTIPQDMSCDPCDAGTVMKVQQTLVKCEAPHAFTFHIDTGELNRDQNLGIWVGFKIGTTDGRATFDNLEVIEANPLTGEALARVKKREHKWKQKWMEKRTKIDKAVQIAQGAIQALFTDSNQNRLKPDITLNHILQVETEVQKIPYVYNAFLQGALPPVPGETYDIFQQLSSAVAIARSLYEQRNVLRNGDFMAGLSNWRGAKGAIVQKIGNASVLVISDWSANLSQDVPVNPGHGYILRVTAKKEGSGEGYVTISDGTEDNTETLKFTVGEVATRLAQSDMHSPMQGRYQERNMTNAPSEAYGTNGYTSHTMTNYPSDNDGTNAYPGNHNRNYQSESFGITPYGDETSMMNGPSNKYEMNAYAGSTYMTNNGVGCSCGCSTNAYAGENMMRNDSSNENGVGYGCGCRTHPNNRTDSYPMTAHGSSLSGYVTKTFEIFPETNRVCIEIGETSGTFKVESIELIRMDCE